MADKSDRVRLEAIVEQYKRKMNEATASTRALLSELENAQVKQSMMVGGLCFAAAEELRAADSDDRFYRRLGSIGSEQTGVVTNSQPQSLTSIGGWADLPGFLPDSPTGYIRLPRYSEPPTPAHIHPRHQSDRGAGRKLRRLHGRMTTGVPQRWERAVTGSERGVTKPRHVALTSIGGGADVHARGIPE
jgi:hypothetical protein